MAKSPLEGICGTVVYVGRRSFLMESACCVDVTMSQDLPAESEEVRCKCDGTNDLGGKLFF
jgi:hypothetical protein